MAERDPHELRPWLRQAARALSDAGIDSARVDAESVAAFVLGVPRGSLVAIDTVSTTAVTRMNCVIAERAQRVPLQHLTGVVGFGPLNLAVGPGVFVPRPETERLLEWAVARCAELHAPARVIDLCSGSGALAIALGTTTSAHITAVENDPDALKWLRRNVTESPHDVRTRIDIVRADVRDPDALTDLHADVVVANPPYVPTDTRLAPEATHDPRTAVFAGPDGMAVITPMLHVVAAILEPGGWFGVEHDDTAQERVLDAVRTSRAFEAIRGHVDLTGRPRFVTARRVTGVGPATQSVRPTG